ncbi:hypothetical protein EDI_151880 [Entamoeba dispar SAW760]|uniref:Uncharacterized protein n=1 Tax=Entamoeba dispar (strain ATCC PRA-260 / SAW760) TaxID=370354 RepID=B0EUH8_ENTDS|nr:uncharacterized protein EDI_151880 [Entamoeba dispar SAW760]EDR21819.1 hypothetical protein EDI_151880 [Entamoeba dispar SAW760]|eukprot:EDR21819.1 hypothetical protein EDI_151880 [Entamoeba dispar SAW760]
MQNNKWDIIYSSLSRLKGNEREIPFSLNIFNSREDIVMMLLFIEKNGSTIGCIVLINKLIKELIEHKEVVELFDNQLFFHILQLRKSCNNKIVCSLLNKLESVIIIIQFVRYHMSIEVWMNSLGHYFGNEIDLEVWKCLNEIQNIFLKKTLPFQSVYQIKTELLFPMTSYYSTLLSQGRNGIIRFNILSLLIEINKEAESDDKYWDLINEEIILNAFEYYYESEDISIFDFISNFCEVKRMTISKRKVFVKNFIKASSRLLNNYCFKDIQHIKYIVRTLYKFLTCFTLLDNQIDYLKSLYIFTIQYVQLNNFDIIYYLLLTWKRLIEITSIRSYPLDHSFKQPLCDVIIKVFPHIQSLLNGLITLDLNKDNVETDDTTTINDFYDSIGVICKFCLNNIQPHLLIQLHHCIKSNDISSFLILLQIINKIIANSGISNKEEEITDIKESELIQSILSILNLTNITNFGDNGSICIIEFLKELRGIALNRSNEKGLHLIDFGINSLTDFCSQSLQITELITRKWSGNKQVLIKVFEWYEILLKTTGTFEEIRKYFYQQKILEKYMTITCKCKGSLEEKKELITLIFKVVSKVLITYKNDMSSSLEFIESKQLFEFLHLMICNNLTEQELFINCIGWKLLLKDCKTSSQQNMMTIQSFIIANIIPLLFKWYSSSNNLIKKEIFHFVKQLVQLTQIPSECEYQIQISQKVINNFIYPLLSDQNKSMDEVKSIIKIYDTLLSSHYYDISYSLFYHDTIIIQCFKIIHYYLPKIISDSMKMNNTLNRFINLTTQFISKKIIQFDTLFIFSLFELITLTYNKHFVQTYSLNKLLKVLFIFIRFNDSSLFNTSQCITFSENIIIQSISNAAEHYDSLYSELIQTIITYYPSLLSQSISIQSSIPSDKSSIYRRMVTELEQRLLNNNKTFSYSSWLYSFINAIYPPSNE